MRSLEQFIQTVKGQNMFWKQNAFLTCSWMFLIFNRLEQLEFKLEKIIGIYKPLGKVRFGPSDFANSRPSASNFKSFSRSLEQFFLTVSQNNFGNKIPVLQLSINLPKFTKLVQLQQKKLCKFVQS